ncbi:MAG TPA: hypothetical protein VN767_20345 [Streptosporangiaceae bacterium]|nr:hypothetical protein [Streptosporangiaceae bacterium]
MPLFTVSEVHGVWGNAATVPSVTGLPGQVAGEPAGVGVLSCPAPGNCSAAGSYQVEGNSGNQLFVMSEANGTWGRAIEIPGTAALNTGLESAVNAIACSSPGNCSAGGFYWTSNQFQDAFVVPGPGRSSSQGPRPRTPGLRPASPPSPAPCRACGVPPPGTWSTIRRASTTSS